MCEPTELPVSFITPLADLHVYEKDEAKFELEVSLLKKEHKATLKSWKKNLRSEVKENIRLCEQIERSNNAERLYLVLTSSEDVSGDSLKEFDACLHILNSNLSCQDDDISSVSRSSTHSVLRQPQSTPLPSITHLRSIISKYHIWRSRALHGCVYQDLRM